jgi:hypothetical protein
LFLSQLKASTKLDSSHVFDAIFIRIGLLINPTKQIAKFAIPPRRSPKPKAIAVGILRGSIGDFC